MKRIFELQERGKKKEEHAEGKKKRRNRRISYIAVKRIIHIAILNSISIY